MFVFTRPKTYEIQSETWTRRLEVPISANGKRKRLKGIFQAKAKNAWGLYSGLGTLGAWDHPTIRPNGIEKP